jgi:hypothetical protein
VRLVAALSPLERATALEKTLLLATAHATAASLGQSPVPDPSVETDLHFVAFVPVLSADAGTGVEIAATPISEKGKGVPGDPAGGGVVPIPDPAVGPTPATQRPAPGSGGLRIVELDGRREGPVDHGPCRNFLHVCVHFLVAVPIICFAHVFGLPRMLRGLSKRSSFRIRPPRTSVSSVLVRLFDRQSRLALYSMCSVKTARFISITILKSTVVYIITLFQCSWRTPKARRPPAGLSTE